MVPPGKMLGHLLATYGDPTFPIADSVQKAPSPTCLLRHRGPILQATSLYR